MHKLLTQDWNKATLQSTVALQNAAGLGLAPAALPLPPLPLPPPPVAARRWKPRWGNDHEEDTWSASDKRRDARVGVRVGARVGVAVGVKVVLLVGANVLLLVGARVGGRVGDMVGAKVGEAVGNRDGGRKQGVFASPESPM